MRRTKAMAQANQLDIIDHETIKFTAMSIAQGAPREAAAIACVVGGLLAHSLGEAVFLYAQSTHSQKVVQEIDGLCRRLHTAGNGLYAIAAVNETGQLLQDAAKSVRGGAQPATAYDMGTPHTTQVSESSSTQTSGFQASDLAAFLPFVGGAAAGVGVGTALGLGDKVPGYKEPDLPVSAPPESSVWDVYNDETLLGFAAAGVLSAAVVAAILAWRRSKRPPQPPRPPSPPMIDYHPDTGPMGPPAPTVQYTPLSPGQPDWRQRVMHNVGVTVSEIDGVINGMRAHESPRKIADDTGLAIAVVLFIMAAATAAAAV